MGLWPFGRAKEDVESASRVVVLRARDGVPMRAKVTLRLDEPQTQGAVDELTEQCADLVRLVVREAPSANAVLGLEAAIATEVTARMPKDAVAIRSVEIAGLHIVGDPGHAVRPAGARDENPAWLHAAPPSSVAPGGSRTTPAPLERPTPIQAIPPVRSAPSAWPASPAPASHLPPAARGLSEPAPAAPTPHMGIPVTARVHAGDSPGGSHDPRVAILEVSADPHGRPATVRPKEPFASTAVSPRPSFDAAERRPDASTHARPASVAPPSHAPSDSVWPPQHGRTDPVTAGNHGRSRPPPGTMPPPGGSQRPPPGTMPAVSGTLRPPAGSMPAASGTLRPPAGSMPVDESSSSSRRFASLAPPPSGSPASIAPMSRAGGSRPPPAAVAARRRVVASRLPMPTRAGPYEVARGLTPLFRDTAGRILVAFLRMYDLTVVRRVPFDAVEGDILSSLTAPSDGAPGAYAASHATEIQRWRDAFGVATMEKLQREANLAATALAFEGLSAEGIAQREANAVVEGLAGAAFGDPDMIIDLGRYLFPAHDTIAAETIANMIEVAGEGMPPGLESALEPLFTSLREDVAAAALIAKDVMTSL